MISVSYQSLDEPSRRMADAMREILHTLRGPKVPMPNNLFHFIDHTMECSSPSVRYSVDIDAASVLTEEDVESGGTEPVGEGDTPEAALRDLCGLLMARFYMEAATARRVAAEHIEKAAILEDQASKLARVGAIADAAARVAEQAKKDAAQ